MYSARTAQLTSGSMIYHAHFEGNKFGFLSGANMSLSIKVDASATAGSGVGLKFTSIRAPAGFSSTTFASNGSTSLASDSKGTTEGERTSICKARIKTRDMYGLLGVYLLVPPAAQKTRGRHRAAAAKNGLGDTSSG